MSSSTFLIILIDTKNAIEYTKYSFFLRHIWRFVYKLESSILLYWLLRNHIYQNWTSSQDMGYFLIKYKFMIYNMQFLRNLIQMVHSNKEFMKKLSNKAIKFTKYFTLKWWWNILFIFLVNTIRWIAFFVINSKLQRKNYISIKHS